METTITFCVRAEVILKSEMTFGLFSMHSNILQFSLKSILSYKEILIPVLKRDYSSCNTSNQAVNRSQVIPASFDMTNASCLVVYFSNKICCILPYFCRYGSKIQTHEERVKQCSDILGKYCYRSLFETKKMETLAKKSQSKPF